MALPIMRAPAPEDGQLCRLCHQPAGQAELLARVLEGQAELLAFTRAFGPLLAELKAHEPQIREGIAKLAPALEKLAPMAEQVQRGGIGALLPLLLKRPAAPAPE